MTNIHITKEEKELLQDLVSGEIQMFYDDIHGYDFANVIEAKDYLTNLKNLCIKLDMNFEEVLKEEMVTSYEKRYIDAILKEVW